MTVTPVVEPESLGIDTERLEELRTRVRREIDDGLLPSCQFALARDGRLAAFETVGDAGSGTRYVIFSATKAFVASAAWLLIGEGSLDIERRVADYIPEFATNGKDVVTIEQVMLHTSGFPRAPLGPPAWADRDRRLEAFARWRLNWEPGTAHEYHATSAHWVLAELIERISGRDYRDFIHERVTGALGLPRVVGIPPGDQDDIAELELCGKPASPDELEAIFGVPELPVTEVTNEALVQFNDPGYRELGVPGGGGIMTAADLALFYQALLHNTGGLWDSDILADGTGRVRTTFPDPLMGVPSLRTLGIHVAGDDGKSSLRGLGKTVSARAFGHGGAGGQIGWADPESGLSVAYCTNGLDAHQIRQARRGVAISSLAGVCASRSG